jgi:hypothetical protein
MERTTVDFWDLTKLLVRRWYVAVPLLLLTAAGAVGLAATIRPDYIADSYMTLVPPRTAAAETNTVRNPWLETGLNALGAAAIYSTQDASVLEPLVQQGYSDNFTLAFDGNSPIIKIEVTATSREQAKATAQQVAQLLSQSVSSLQQEYNVPRDQLITTQRLDRGDNIKSSTTKLKRAVIAVIGAGLLLSIALTAMVDAILQRRSRRRSAAPPVAAPRTPPAGGANGTGRDLSTLRDRETELITSAAGKERAGAAPKRQGGGEYRTAAREQADAARFTPSGDEAQQVAPMPSDATIILPLPEKETWALRDGGANGGSGNRGGSGRR